MNLAILSFKGGFYILAIGFLAGIVSIVHECFLGGSMKKRWKNENEAELLTEDQRGQKKKYQSKNFSRRVAPLVAIDVN